MTPSVTEGMAREDALDRRARRTREVMAVLAGAYAERMVSLAQERWTSAPENEVEIHRVAVHVIAQGPPEGDAATATTLVHGFFADKWARDNRWPWKALAKNPGRYRQAGGATKNERAVAEYEEAAKARDEAYRKGDHAEGQRLERVAKETYERAFGRTAS